MALATILPRAMVRNSFDMAGLVAYALGAVNKRGLRRLYVTEVPQALAGRTIRQEKKLEIHVRRTETGNAAITVRDNGGGIAPENLTRIFGHGFTTKKDGHGFGLHSGALAAKEMNGSLTVHSDGLGQGAAFTLELPPAKTTDAEQRAKSSAMAGVNN